MDHTEEMLLKISAAANEITERLELNHIHPEVELSYFDNESWHINVRPALLTHKTETMLITHGYHGTTLNETLANALEGTTEELELLKKGMTKGFP